MDRLRSGVTVDRFDQLGTMSEFHSWFEGMSCTMSPGRRSRRTLGP